MFVFFFHPQPSLPPPNTMFTSEMFEKATMVNCCLTSYWGWGEGGQGRSKCSDYKKMFCLIHFVFDCSSITTDTITWHWKHWQLPNLSASSRMIILCLPFGKVTFCCANILILFLTTSIPLGTRKQHVKCYCMTLKYWLWPVTTLAYFCKCEFKCFIFLKYASNTFWKL